MYIYNDRWRSNISSIVQLHEEYTVAYIDLMNDFLNII
jgi:hypothetical protein